MFADTRIAGSAKQAQPSATTIRLDGEGRLEGRAANVAAAAGRNRASGKLVPHRENRASFVFGDGAPDG